jgi:TonB family protein
MALPPISAMPPTPSVLAARPFLAEPPANQLKLTRSGASALPPAPELILSSSTGAPSGAASGLQPAKAIASPEVPLEDGASAALASVSAPQPATVRPFVSELPQSGVAAPALSQPNFVGTVKLHLIIGTDGSVKDVHVLSGDARAAKSAVAAVKTWRYSPHEVDGHAVEAQTMVGISFFGRDAVSARPLR